MLIVDDILFFPVKGINWIFKQIHEIAEEELAGEGDRIRNSLTELYMMLETGQITEEEFDQQEKVLLDRLDTLEEDDDIIDNETGEEEEEEEEEIQKLNIEKKFNFVINTSRKSRSIISRYRRLLNEDIENFCTTSTVAPIWIW